MVEQPIPGDASGNDACCLFDFREQITGAENALAEARTALLKAGDRYKAIFDGATDGIFIYDLEARLLEVNRVACERLGYAASEMIGKTADLMDVPELADQIHLRIALVRQYGSISFETVHLTRTGEMIPVEVNARLIDYSGSPAILSIARDITDRKHAELALVNANQALADANEALEASNAALRESEQKFRSLVESSPDGVALVDESGRLIEFNPAYQAIYGITAEQALGKTLVDFTFDSLPPELRVGAAYTELKREVRQALRRGNSIWLGVIREQEICRPDGQRRFTQTIVFPIHTDRGYMLGVISRDVTAHRQAELELEQYRQRLEGMVADRTIQLQREIQERLRYEQQLKDSLAEKEVMLREIHHRVKNNLNIIIALIDLQKDGQTDPQVLQLFKELQSRAYSMSLVHESLYRSPNLAHVDFSGYLHTLVSYLFSAYNLPGNGLPVRLDIEVEQVALNIETAVSCGLMVNELVTNALKYAFPTKALLEDARLLIQLERSGPAAQDPFVLTVSDNGVGFPDGMDWQSSPSLGLQLVRVLARQLGGKLEVDTTHGVLWRLTFRERK